MNNHPFPSVHELLGPSDCKWCVSPSTECNVLAIFVVYQENKCCYRYVPMFTSVLHISFVTCTILVWKIYRLVLVTSLIKTYSTSRRKHNTMLSSYWAWLCKSYQVTECNLETSPLISNYLSISFMMQFSFCIQLQ